MSDVTAVNWSRRLALMSDGGTAALETLLDTDGDETDDPASAVVAVAPYAGRWFVVELADFADTENH